MPTKKLTEVFSIDLRALAIVRIFLAIIVLTDICRRLPDLTIFYGDGGVLPTRYVSTFWTGDWAWSLHTLFGGPEYLLGFLFFVYAIAALTLLVGFHTRIATIVVWFLTISLHNANPLILQGEDVLLRIVLFVSMFLPLGAVYSIDRWRGKEPYAKNILSGWTVAYLLQLGFMYFFVSLFKHSSEWVGGTAIYYALSIDQYATPFGRYLLHFPETLSFLTYSVLIFQSFALFLLFFPFYTRYVRTLTTLGLMFMHAAFAASMNLGMFSAVSIAALVGFVPSPVWDWIESQILKSWKFLRSLSFITTPNEVYVPQSRTASAISIVGLAYIVYIFFWHAGNSFVEGQYVPFGHGFEIPAKVLRLDQRWNLFAPYPYKHDGWIIIDTELVNGEHIDLFKNGAPLSFERPPVIYDLYPRPRWRRYFLSLWGEGNAMYRVPYAQYLCRTWDEAHPDNKIKNLDVIYMVEYTQPPGKDAVPVRPTSLIVWDCETNQQLAR